MEESMMNFIFSIQPIKNENGAAYFEPVIINNGVPDEIIITMLRTWLRDAEDKYYSDFKQHLL